MATETESWLGAVLSGNRYRIVRLVGEGGMGRVYHAWDNTLVCEVVVKAPRSSASDNPEFARRFELEIQSLVRLSHPRIVKILDVGRHEGRPFAVMQSLGGGTLKDRAAVDDAGRRLPCRLEELETWLRPIAEALDFIHKQGFVHRDVKPTNILFDTHGNAYLSDFGVAKALAALEPTTRSEALTGAGVIVGTAGYMAPEMMMDQPYDGRADQYALAMTVYEMLAGVNPFDGMSLPVILVKQTTEQVPPLHGANPSIPRALSQAVHRGLATEPGLRYAGCGSFAQAVLATLSIGSPGQNVVVPPTVPPSRQTDPMNEPVRLLCPACNSRVRLYQQHAGKAVRCPNCRISLTASDDLKRLVPKTSPAIAVPVLPTAPPDTDPVRQAGQPTQPSPPPAPRARGGRWVARLLAFVLFVGLIAAGVVGYMHWTAVKPDDRITRDDVITGRIRIDFKTRRGPKNNTAQDEYVVDLRVRTQDDAAVVYKGRILRRPRPEDGRPVSGEQPGLTFDINVTSQKLDSAGNVVESAVKQVGRIRGKVPHDAQGIYHFDDLVWSTPIGGDLTVKGAVQGKKGAGKEKVERELPYEIDGKWRKVKIKKADPMKFDRLELPRDPALGLPAATINGELTYNYDSGNYLTNELSFSYGGNSDLVHGTILWEKDSEYLRKNDVAGGKAEDRKSQYIFTLVFQPMTDKKGKQAKAFDNLFEGDEKDIMHTSPAMSMLEGIVTYRDTGKIKMGDGGELEIEPLESDVTFNLRANKLTPDQINTFLKMWLLMSGPVNDE